MRIRGLREDSILRYLLSFVIRYRRITAMVVVLVAIGVGALFRDQEADLLGRVAVEQALAGRYTFAYALARTALLLQDSARAHDRLGDVYREAQEYELAAGAYQEAILRDLSYPGAHYKRGRMFFAMGNFSQAVAEVTREIERNPNHVKAKYTRGLAYSYLANWPAAEEDFNDLLAHNPNWPWTRIDLSWVYLSQGKNKEAEVLLRRTLENVPYNVWALNNLGLALMHQGRYDEAVKVFEEAIVAVGETDQDEFLMAYPLKRPEQFQEGLRELLQGIQFNLALIEEKRGNLHRAISLFQKLADNQNVATGIRGVSMDDIERHVKELQDQVSP